MVRRQVTVVTAVLFASSLAGQRTIAPLPKEARTAKTVAIVNNTHNEGVEQGAVDAIARWGRLTVVDDADLADLVLVFDKKSEHEGSNTQTKAADGTNNTSYNMSFSSSIHMRATLKGAASSFYSTSTGESKKKAGAACVTDLQGAFNASH